MSGYVWNGMFFYLAIFLLTTCLDKFVKLHVSLCWLWVLFTSSRKLYFPYQNPYWLKLIYVALHLQFLLDKLFITCFLADFINPLMVAIISFYKFRKSLSLFEKLYFLWITPDVCKQSLECSEILNFSEIFFFSIAVSNLNTIW